MPWPPGRYCRRCKSRIFPADEADWQATGLCSYCKGQDDRAARLAAEDQARRDNLSAQSYHDATKHPWEE